MPSALAPPDTPALKRRVTWNLLTSPWTLLPAAAGAVLVGAGAVALSPVALLGGAATLAVGAGVVATRWVVGAEGLTERAYAELSDEQRAAAERALDDLDKALRRDRDQRTELHLRRLRELHGLLVEEPGVPPEVRARAEELVGHSVQALRRTLQMLGRARSLRTVEAHRRLLADREQVIAEVADNVAALARALDDVRAMRSGDRDESKRLADVRQELGRSLEVARRVDERLKRMETGDEYADVVGGVERVRE